VTRSGIPVRVAVYRTEPPSDYVVPPAIYGVSLKGSEVVVPQRAKANKAARRRGLPRCPDLIFRSHYPLDVSPSSCATTRVVVFGTAETDAATDVQSFQQKKPEIDASFWAALDPGIVVLTPSVWSASLLLSSGAPIGQLRVLPHGFDPKVFYPAPSVAARAALRAALGWDEGGCVVVITVGHMRWKKGIDALLPAAVAAARALRAGECLRLVLKGVDALYDSSAKVESLLDEAGLRDDARALFAAGRLVLDVRGETLPVAGVADLLRAADALVSPYRAEGFNLPVLEAAACGLPVIMTAGGAADAFTDPSFARAVKSEVVRGGPSGTAPGAVHVEPDTADLTAALLAAVRDAAWRAHAAAAAAPWVRAANFSWDDVARRHAALFFAPPGAAVDGSGAVGKNEL